MSIERSGSAAATVYEGASEKSRIVIRRVAFVVCMVISGVCLALIALNVIQGYFGWDFWFLPPILAVSLLSALLTHRGRVTTGAALMTTGLLVVIGVEPYFALGSEVALAMYVAVNSAGFAVCILLAGLFVRTALLVAVTVAASLDLAVLAVLSRSPEIQVSAPYASLAILACGALTLVFSKVFRGALRAAREEARNAVLLREQLLQAQKMEALGRFAGGITHDFNNILAAIGARADLALMDEGGGSRAPMTEIREYVDRAAALVRRLLLFSRKTRSGEAVFDTAESVRGLQGMLERLLGRGVELSVSVAPGSLPVRGDQGQFEQVIMNLVVNARDALPGEGRIEIDLSKVEGPPPGGATTPPLGPGTYVSLTVRDNGSGMSPEVMERLFEPFFTTKPEGVGTGLGLSTVYAIVSGAGGGVSVQSELGAGSTFTLFLPCP